MCEGCCQQLLTKVHLLSKAGYVADNFVCFARLPGWGIKILHNLATECYQQNQEVL